MNYQDFKLLTPDNGAIKNLRDLLIMTNFMDEKLEDFFTLRQSVAKGDKLGWTGEMSDIGWAGAGCKPTFKKATINAAEKTWDIGSWQIPLEWCYTELEGTIAEYCLKTGTEIGDLTSTEYMDYIVYPALDKAIQKMFWRFVWFGDKDAKLASASGNITAGVDVELFKTCNGFWKQLFAIGTANPKQKTAIAANSEATTLLQRSELKKPDVAIGIFESMFDDADPRIASMDGAAVFCTKSLADALSRDLKRKHNQILEWTQVFGGLDVTEYDGHKIYRVSIWDRFIETYQNNGTTLNLPHRAVFCSPSQLLVGTPANDIVSNLEVWFNKDERTNKVYATGKLGCLIGEDNLFQMAY